MKFVPMVAEYSGAWDIGAVQILHHVDVRLPPAFAKIRSPAPAFCSNSSGSPFGRAGLERCCGAAVLCFK